METIIAEPILDITSKLTQVAELIMDIDPDQIGEDELTRLKERLPQWALTVGVINRSVRDLEKRVLTDERQ